MTLIMIYRLKKTTSMIDIIVANCLKCDIIIMIIIITLWN